jgi:hypothetical protein
VLLHPRSVYLGIAGAVVLSLSAHAGGQGNGKSHGKSEQVIQGTGTGVAVAGVLITVAEQSIIANYVQQYRGSPSYGFAGAQPLPPGIAKKIARGGAMPPGIAKRYLPPDLLSRLPPRPGQQWVAVGTDILLVDAATQVVLDILHQAL